MAEHNETGRKGEKVAKSYLENRGWIILATNWRMQRAEVDLLALDEDVLVGVEVKTRTSFAFGRPAEFVHLRKLKMMADATMHYAQSISHDGEIRFDIVGVLYVNDQNQRLVHHKDVFFPGRWWM